MSHMSHYLCINIDPIDDGSSHISPLELTSGLQALPQDRPSLYNSNLMSRNYTIACSLYRSPKSPDPNAIYSYLSRCVYIAQIQAQVRRMLCGIQAPRQLPRE